MKQILLFTLMLFAYVANAQQQNITVDSIAIGRKPASKINLDGSITAKNFNGKRPITGSVATGQNPNTNDLVAWLNAVFYPSQAPTASLIGGQTYELTSQSLIGPINVNWTIGRQNATEPINSIIISNNLNSTTWPQSFSQPAAGSTVSGTQGFSIGGNINQTLTVTATSTDGKSASAPTSFTFLPKRYWGRTTSAAATESDLLASAGGSNTLSNSKAGTFSITANGSNRVFYAYPSNLGDLSSINIGGLESLSSFTKTVINFTNASGYTQNYNVYTSNNETGGNVTAVIQ